MTIVLGFDCFLKISVLRVQASKFDHSGILYLAMSLDYKADFTGREETRDIIGGRRKNFKYPAVYAIVCFRRDSKVKQQSTT